MKRISKNKILLLVSLVVLMLLPEFLFRWGSFTGDHHNDVHTIEQKLSELIEDSRNESVQLARQGKNWDFISIIKTQNTGFFIFENGKLIWWNQPHFPINEITSGNFKENEGFLKAGNGYYYLLTEKNKNITVRTLVLIKKEHVFENRYLDQNFNPAFKISEGLALNTKNEGAPVKYKGKTLFYIDHLPEGDAHLHDSLLLILIVLISYGFVCILVRDLLLARNNSLRNLWLFVTSILLLRGIFLIPHTFTIFGQNELFSPEVFASGMITPSLGDFFINAWTVFFIINQLAKSLSGQKQQTLRLLYWCLLMPLFIFLSWHIGSNTKKLVEDSGIDFSIRDINSFSLYSILALIALGWLFYALFQVIDRMVKIARNTDAHIYFFITVAVSVALLYFINSGNSGGDIFVSSLSVIVFVFHYLFLRGNRMLSLNEAVVILIIFAAGTSISLTRHGEVKEARDRLILAEELADEQDPDFEDKFSRIQPKLQTDSLLQLCLDTSLSISSNTFENYLDNKYFQKIYKEYDISYFLFRSDSSSLFASIYDISHLRDAFKLMQKSGKKTASPDLFFIYNKADKLDYIGRINIEPVNGVSGILIIEFKSKSIPENLGLNELLLHKNQLYSELLSNYSYIKFIDGVPVSSLGNYKYSTSPEKYLTFNKKYNFIDEKDVNHLVYRINLDSFLVLTRLKGNLLTRATSFSYILIIFTILFLGIYLVLNIDKISLSSLTLRGKIQLTLILLVLIAMVVFGIVTNYIVGEQYQKKNFQLVSEKLSSISIELSHKISKESVVDEDLKNYLHYLLTKFSKVFVTDINFYNKNGNLVASSRSKVFRYGISSNLMNPNAYEHLKKDKYAEFIQEESIDNLHYISGYIPFLNHENEVLGYLHIPYFARQNALYSEVSGLFMAIVNIFVLLFAITLLAAILVTQIITAPLRKIQSSISSIQLNKVNRPIIYSGKDEIADLVNEYNHKVGELETYARVLAQSERESAWREMAKQVAHEIKNPLTPMKLNIQHMQRSLKPDDPDFESKLQRISSSLIEQIDTLSHIASEFSTFAKMPKTHQEEVELVSLIESTRDIFTDEGKIKINFHHEAVAEARVLADKEQLIRVFNNLLKNAVQAIPEESQGLISILLEEDANEYTITVEDNGVGIHDNVKEKIFSPNFTTKSTGTGLGLAMVKNIIELHGGKIWFETTRDKGSRFIFTLPVLKN